MIGYQFISDYIMSEKLTPVIKMITNFGGARVLSITTLLLLIIIKDKKIGVGILINLCTATGLNLILKSLLQRPRPT